jgi:hypothetical protein
VHGAEYFTRLIQILGATLEGDRIFFTDWRGDADELLAEGGPTIGDVLVDAVGRGVEVRCLLWRYADAPGPAAREGPAPRGRRRAVRHVRPAERRRTTLDSSTWITPRACGLGAPKSRPPPSGPTS